MKHLDNNNILTDLQHAFRRNRSCETQLINVIDDWSKCLEKGLQVDSFVLDFEKAFDTVPHELLKLKLHSYGVSKQVLNWISAFLSNRSQSVVVNGSSSNKADVLSGVPQGTVLGPILFIIFINDIVKCVDSQIRLFADDCVCYRIIRNINDCLALQKDIDRLGKWARDWGMRFQPSKCNMIRFSKKKMNTLFDYTLEGSKLVFLDRIKYLGVNITSDLNWSFHVNAVCKKAYRTLGLLKRNLTMCPASVKLQAFKGLIRPGLEYASAAWDPYQLYLQDNLEKVQKQSARFITGNYSYEPGSMTSILNQLKLPPLAIRRKQNRLILMYKALAGKAALPLQDLHHPTRLNRNKHPYCFRQLHNRSDLYKHSFIPNTIVAWNALPISAFGDSEIAPEYVERFTNYLRKNEI